MPSPVITLLTDFGLADHYVAVMKGVILGINPEARIVGITHQVPPFAVATASYLLVQAWPCFPDGTIHVAVVDPGVGSERRPIFVEAHNHWFVGPDNGVFSFLEAACVRHIQAERYFRHPVSQSFHGRDIFAPVAAHLASGVDPAELGPPVHDRVLLPANQRTILHVDRFGNLITSLPATPLPDFTLVIGAKAIARFATNYAEVPKGELFLIAGSSGYWEISANQASAAELTGAVAGDAFQLTPLQDTAVRRP